jgi:hypothetical protein
MVLGQSAATAAALALDGGQGVQAVDYPQLRQKLLADGQVLDWTGPRRDSGIDARQLPGIVIDDNDAERQGFSYTSSASTPFVNDGYRHDGNEEHGQQWARYRPEVATAGKYEVRLSYAPHANRATNVPVTIVHADGQSLVTVNQRRAPTLDRAFVSLGSYRFVPGRAGYVEIRNAGADGYVIIDAVQWLPVKE